MVTFTHFWRQVALVSTVVCDGPHKFISLSLSVFRMTCQCLSILGLNQQRKIMFAGSGTAPVKNIETHYCLLADSKKSNFEEIFACFH